MDDEIYLLPSDKQRAAHRIKQSELACFEDKDGNVKCGDDQAEAAESEACDTSKHSLDPVEFRTPAIVVVIL